MSLVTAFLCVNTIICSFSAMVFSKRKNESFVYIANILAGISCFVSFILNLVYYTESYWGIFLFLISAPQFFIAFCLTLFRFSFDYKEKPDIALVSLIVILSILITCVCCLVFLIPIEENQYIVDNNDVVLVNSSDKIKIEENGIDLSYCYFSLEGNTTILYEKNTFNPHGDNIRFASIREDGTIIIKEAKRSEYRINIVEDLEYPYYTTNEYSCTYRNFIDGVSTQSSSTMTVYDIYARESDIYVNEH